MRTGLRPPTRTCPTFIWFMAYGSDLSGMATVIRGWEGRYARILDEFGYSRSRDRRAARVLDSVLRAAGAGGHQRVLRLRLKNMILDRPVFVVGAGPSVYRAPPILGRHGKSTVIAADSAVGPLIRSGVFPDIVVTDLDGDLGALRRASRRAIMVVHAHGDNIDKLHMAASFAECVGTAQSGSYGAVSSFGGFTDGDRSVFLAHHFGAKRIVLLGMDMGCRIGRHSQTSRSERQTKLAKLRVASSLLGWLATKNPEIYSTSEIPGVRRIVTSQIDGLMAA